VLAAAVLRANLWSYCCSYDKYGVGDADARGHAGEFFTSCYSGGGGGVSERDFFSFIFRNMFFHGGHGFRGYDFDDSMRYNFADVRTEPYVPFPFSIPSMNVSASFIFS
jgi:DnaJ-class molecular chaperone